MTQSTTGLVAVTELKRQIERDRQSVASWPEVKRQHYARLLTMLLAQPVEDRRGEIY